MHTDNMILMWQVEESVTMGGAGYGCLGFGERAASW
jgi:hypothetical protein